MSVEGSPRTIGSGALEAGRDCGIGFNAAAHLKAHPEIP